MPNKIYNTIIESCLIFLIIFTPLAHGAVEPWSIAVFEIVAVLMASAWILSMLNKGEIRIIKIPILTIIVSLFLLYVILQYILPQASLLTSIYKHATRTELYKIISYLLIFTVILHTVTTKKKINRIISVIIGVAFLMSIFFLVRYFGAPAPRGIINPDHFAGYLAMVIPLSIGFFLLNILALPEPCAALRDF